MKKRLMCVVSMLAFIMVFACQSAKEPTTQTAQESAKQTVKDSSVKKMAITGEIAQGANSYIIRGKVPAMIFTVLNPDPKILDGFVKTEKIVKIEVRIVSGDNVAIEMLDGKEYIQKIQ